MTLPEVMVVMILTGILCITVMGAASIMGKLESVYRERTGTTALRSHTGIAAVQDSLCMSGLDSLKKMARDYETEQRKETVLR